MARKKKDTIPSGFSDILGTIYSNSEEGAGITDIDSLDTYDTPPVELDDDKEEPPVNKTEDGNAETAATDEHDDNSPIPKEVVEQMNDDNTPPADVNNDGLSTEDEPSDADVLEAQQVGLLFDAVGQSLGWNMADIKEEDRPLTVDDLTEYLKEVVNQNSIPQYADERVQKLDEYVKQGGRFEDFYAKQQEAISFDNLNMDDESNQKAVVRELLRYNGYTDEQINSKIARYEDADMLAEESEDALDRLKTIRQHELEEASKRQEAYAKQQEEQQRAFFQQVTNDISNLTNIRGIAIPKEDRKALFDYIFKVDQNGMTQYSKDFNQNLSKNLIESAYFTMKADALISSAKTNGESSAAEKLRKMLRHSTKNHTVYNADDKQKSATDLLTGMF